MDLGSGHGGRSFSGMAGVVNTVSPLRAAQFGARTTVALEAGPLERVAVRPTLDMPAPRRTLHVAPNWPPDVAVAVQVPRAPGARCDRAGR